MSGKRFIACLLLLFSTAQIYADEQVRQVQEELRRRNLYFGDIDGTPTPELENALRRYQARKGIGVTGTIDDATATSLDLQPRTAKVQRAVAPLPDVPVLRSDSARALPEQERIALEKEAETNPEATQSPAPPAEAPAQNMTPERINTYVEQYLRESETSDIPAQVKYFSYPVQYFDHGQVGAEFVNKDVGNYVKRWPERKYTLLAPPNVTAGAKEGEARVEFTIDFDVRNSKHVAKGRTDNFWTVRQEGDDLKIVAIREQRIRD
ncbi:MAG: peptidoglycan-binding protein [Chthoniobacterales bacterium]